MKKNIITLLLLLTFIKLFSQNKLNCVCNRLIEPEIEIWYKNNKNNLINYYNNYIFVDENKYILQHNGWNNENLLYPKNFDIKLILWNNINAYDLKIVKYNYIVNLKMRFKISKNPNSLYPLNHKYSNDITLMNFLKIDNKIFNDTLLFYELKFKDFNFEKYYNKYRKNGFFINQIIFYINVSNKNEYCNYEYSFNMKENGEY